MSLDPVFTNDSKPPAKPLPELYRVLEDLATLGGVVDVNGEPRALRQAIYRYRKKYGKEKKFLVRQLSPGRCRIWRTA